MNNKNPSFGHIYLVGAGPGDPELLTLKAAKLIENADYLVHDGLVSDEILALAPENTIKISVAKQRSRHSLPQDKINSLLVDLCKGGANVVRLKGGDPFIFGRGGEELEYCRANGCNVNIVPGISAAIGSAAQHAMPLTHRDHSSIVSFVAGQCKGLSDQNWAGLAGNGRTLVIYMGLANAHKITEKLIADGLSPNCPVAIIENGTREYSRSYRSILDDLSGLAKRNAIKSPAIIIVGDIVNNSDAQAQFASIAAQVETESKK
ncbi:uroporphyrinogen-III C-methyltransferase [Sphingorhabdus lutea]|uniref:uroporphyrinogen-III C-methyltransferase n=1 Tax=Sphingorhabdus lutea TaxID=1913578 RepID=A0A1L3JB56_9SPHN|nr:uroporphyrinogen-III C-methyltransferase [Sphingorhabdus lutea]APG62362.1 uroporphyrinogen-III C-methyltransferase [Sphingorhabdus lutea]